MSKRIRLALLGVSAVAALGFASAALGAFSPSFSILRGVDLSSRATTTSFTFVANATDDPTVKLQILAPAGFTATLNQAVGAQLGTVDGQIELGPAFANAVVPVTGIIEQGDTSSAELKAVAKLCTGQENHGAIWLLRLSVAGQTPSPVPLFVDLVTTPPFSAFASTSIALCLPHPSKSGYRILNLSAVTGVIAPPTTPGAFRWTAINTPYKADGTPNPAGTVETQAIDNSPVEASFNAKRVTKTRKVNRKNRTDIFYSYFARISGSVEAGGEGAAGVSVDILVDKKKVATATTNDSGRFTKTMKLTKTTTFHAQYAREAAPLTGATCQPPLPLAPGVDMPCGTITEGGFTVTTDEVTVKKPKLKVKHIKKKKKKKRRH